MTERLDVEDWDGLRRLGHRMLDDVMDGFQTLRERPVWKPIPGSVREELRSRLPREAIGAEAAYDEFREFVAPYPRGNCHPRFWGWVNGSGLPIGVLAELLAAAMNPSVGAFENAATLVEEQVLEWLKEMLGFPASSSGLLTSGCSMSNVIALAVARTSRAAVDVRRTGLIGAPRRMLIYASEEAHSSVRKAVELLGLGSEALRSIPVGQDFRMHLGALEDALDADGHVGAQPFCVVGNAGTVNTGAIDDLEGIADICSARGLWFHVDGAFGALAWICPELRDSLRGLQRADSLAFDLHKWMYQPYDVGCVLVRDAVTHREAFSVAPGYLSRTEGGPAAHPTSFADVGIELTRRFRALKVWMSIKAHGLGAFERQIRENIEQAAYLARRIEAHPSLELKAPVRLNVVCFRYVLPNVGAAPLDKLNHDVLVRLQQSGIAMPSHTWLNGQFVLRAAVTNHRSRYEDFDILVDEVARLGAQAAECVADSARLGGSADH